MEQQYSWRSSPVIRFEVAAPILVYRVVEENMNTVKKIAGVVVLVGVAVLTVTGATQADIGVLVTIGIGAGTALAAIISFLKSR